MNNVISGISGVTSIAAYAELLKPRPLFMVLLSTAAGFYLGVRGGMDLALLFAALLGTFCVGGGAMALNQYLECAQDALMTRTSARPIPSGRIRKEEALAFGLGLSLAGFLVFIFWVNPVSLCFAFATWFGYLYLYTPLKKVTSLATLIGAVPGALPMVIGWTAAKPAALGIEAATLFAIVFFWQLPHFLSIAWMYREDYRRAGFKTLSVLEGGSFMAARQMILNICALIPVSLLPSLFGLTGPIYFFGAFLLGLFFAGAVIFASSNLTLGAPYVLRASVIYLALIFIFMIADKA